MRSKSRPPGRSADHADGLARPSFEEVYRENFAYVFWLLRHLGVPEHSCEDAAQEVFLVVNRRLHEYEPRDKLRGWLGAIAANIAAKVRHREGRRMKTTEAGPDARDEADDVDLDKDLASAEEVRRILQDVAPDLRFLFIQHHLVDVPVAEIAKHFDLPEGTIKTRLRLSRAAVKAAWIRYKARERHAEKRSNVVPIFGPLTFMEAGREIPPVPDDVRARVWAGIQNRLGGGGGGEGDGPGSEAPGRAAPRSVSRALRAAVASPAGRALRFIVTMGLGVVLGALWDPLHRPRDASPDVPSLTTAEVAPPAPPPVPAPAPAPAASSARPTASMPPASSSAVVVVGAVDLDNVLVDRAEAALQSGQIGRALASAQEHTTLFHGGGRRAQDREAVWIAALLRAGRAREARERLTRFEAVYPNSPRLEGFRKALGGP